MSFYDTRSLSSLHTWEKNPRSITTKEFERLKKLISTLGLFKPFLITDDGTVLGGNMRLRAVQELGFTEVPVSVVVAETDQKKLEYALADNDRAGEYDQQQLAELITEIPEINLEDFHVDLGMSISLEDVLKQFNGDELDDNYSKKIGEVVYEPKETHHEIKDLFTKETKFDKDIDSLKNEELKDMLRARVSYFSDFHYAKIADYYAYQATVEEQKILERLAFVLLDKNQLIEHGFSEIIERLTHVETPKT